MKTNVTIELDDRQRAVLARAIGKRGLATRADIKEHVPAWVRECCDEEDEAPQDAPRQVSPTVALGAAELLGLVRARLAVRGVPYETKALLDGVLREAIAEALGLPHGEEGGAE